MSRGTDMRETEGGGGVRFDRRTNQDGTRLESEIVKEWTYRSFTSLTESGWKTGRTQLTYRSQTPLRSRSIGTQ